MAAVAVIAGGLHSRSGAALAVGWRYPMSARVEGNGLMLRRTSRLSFEGRFASLRMRAAGRPSEARGTAERGLAIYAGSLSPILAFLLCFPVRCCRCSRLNGLGFHIGLPPLSGFTTKWYAGDGGGRRHARGALGKNTPGRLARGGLAGFRRSWVCSTRESIGRAGGFPAARVSSGPDSPALPLFHPGTIVPGASRLLRCW